MGILRSASVVSGATFLSRILGMARDIACASLLGAGAAWDAFVIAWRVPNLFRRLLGEGALSSAFIPVFTGEREKNGRTAAFAFFASVLTLLSIVLAALTALGVLAALFLPAHWFGAGGAEAKAALTLDLLAMLFPYVFLINVMALFMAILNSEGHFFAPAIAPAVLNVFWITGAVASPLVSDDPAVRVKVVAAAILAGGVVQLFLQVPFLRSRGIPLKPRLDVSHPALGRMLLLMFPMIAGLAPVQVNLLIDTLIAEAFIEGDGANSYLFYGNRLMQFPLALVGIALAVVSFPLFARLAKEGKREELSSKVREALGLTFFLALPSAFGLLALATPLIELIYEWGRFGAADTSATSRVLFLYSVGIPAFCGLQIVTRLFYALEDVKTPVRVGAAMVVVNLALNLLLVGPMEEGGLALATSLSAGLNVAILFWLVPRKLGLAGLGPVLPSILKSLTIAAAMGALVWFVHSRLAAAYPDPTLGAKLMRTVPAVLLGGVGYVGAAFLIRLPEVRGLIRR
ncbi:MAG: murein biosynthesis integral membrane protein MurJ [Planctomycetota bacterium]